MSVFGEIDRLAALHRLQVQAIREEIKAHHRGVSRRLRVGELELGWWVIRETPAQGGGILVRERSADAALVALKALKPTAPLVLSGEGSR